MLSPSEFELCSIKPYFLQEPGYSLDTLIAPPRTNLGPPVYLPKFPFHGAGGYHHQDALATLLEYNLEYNEDVLNLKTLKERLL